MRRRWQPPWPAPAMDVGGGRESRARTDPSLMFYFAGTIFMFWLAARGRGSERRWCPAIVVWVRPDLFQSITTGGEEGEAWLPEKSEP
jgi:hypothetical protein